MTNLVIDAGNTLTKVAFFENNTLSHLHTAPLVIRKELEPMMKEYKPGRAIISDVSDKTSAFSGWLEEKLPVLHMDADTPSPLHMEYQSPGTLGSDRLAAAVYGASLYPHNNTLTIQAGTCITYEFVTREKTYMGGAISPGLDMRFHALHTFTAKLPLVKKEKINFLTGKNTQASVLSGVINGCSAEIDGIIDQYKAIYPDLMVMIGGGDAFFFDKTLKNRIFALQNLVLRGLNLILEHNHTC